MTPKEKTLLKLQEEIKIQCEHAIFAYEGLLQTMQDESIKQAIQLEEETTKFRNEIAQNPNYSYQDLDQAMQNLQQARQTSSHKLDQQRIQIFFFIQALLISTANVSKLLWSTPQDLKNNKEEKELRKELREKLSIDDNNAPRFQDRTMRNYFEHFDTKVMEWAKSSNIMIDLSIATPSIYSNFDKKYCLRCFNPTNMTITFWEHETNLRFLIEDIKNLFKKIKEKEEENFQAIIRNARTTNEKQYKN